MLVGDEEVGLEVKPMLKCLKLAFFLIASRGRLLWLQKEV